MEAVSEKLDWVEGKLQDLENRVAATSPGDRVTRFLVYDPEEEGTPPFPDLKEMQALLKLLRKKKDRRVKCCVVREADETRIRNDYTRVRSGEVPTWIMVTVKFLEDTAYAFVHISPSNEMDVDERVRSIVQSVQSKTKQGKTDGPGEINPL